MGPLTRICAINTVPERVPNLDGSAPRKGCLRSAPIADVFKIQNIDSGSCSALVYALSNYSTGHQKVSSLVTRAPRCLTPQ